MLNQFLFSDFVSIFYQTISCHLLVYISLYQIRYIKCADFPPQKAKKGTTGFLTVNAIFIETSGKIIGDSGEETCCDFFPEGMAHALRKCLFENHLIATKCRFLSLLPHAHTLLMCKLFHTLQLPYLK